MFHYFCYNAGVLCLNYCVGYRRTNCYKFFLTKRDDWIRRAVKSTHYKYSRKKVKKKYKHAVSLMYIYKKEYLRSISLLLIQQNGCNTGCRANKE